MSVDLTADEAFESLTGFDELAIEKHFGSDVATLASTSQMTCGRALVFVFHRRDGMSDVDAKHAAMSLTIKEVNDFFADDSGKGETQPEEQPSN